MTNKEALELANKGFTAEEIRALGWSAETETEATEPEETPEVENPEIETKEINTDFMDTINKMSATVEGLTKTVKALQENNQKVATIPENGNVPKSADEVIKGFIENM